MKKAEAVDFVIEGEGPDSLRVLLSELATAQPDLSRVPGLWYRDSGTICSNPRAALISDLDSYLPIAAWDLLPMERYLRLWYQLDAVGPGLRGTSVIATVPRNPETPRA